MSDINVLDIIAHTLSMMDIRLIDHGKNVAFITYNAMKISGRYTENEINNMCIIAVLHDIGAFKTEEINNILSFDYENAWDHSTYGYLFIKKFSPLFSLAPIIFFHHTSLQYMNSVPEYYRDLSQILHIADRLEIASRFGGREKNALLRHYSKGTGKRFSPHILNLFFEDHKMQDREEFWHGLCQNWQKRSDIDEYLAMLILSIDFRSRHTVNHTVATAEFSRQIAGLFLLPEEDLRSIGEGSLLHDIGKAGIPVSILENPGRLNEQEMEIMKTHILLTGQILNGRVPKKVKKVACRHHEKLDGSGYPAGLTAAQLTLPERIVAVSDILSALSGARSYKNVFPKEQVISILTGMAEKGQIDTLVVQKIVDNYDFLMQKTAEATKPVTLNYEAITSDYNKILEKISTMEQYRDFQFGFLCLEPFRVV
jgi:HD-GYP domain-containing protein (c-di-GMP phosphodiesterase class II)